MDEALACYEVILQLQPNCASIYICRHLPLIEQGRVREAIASLREALRLDPDCIEAQGNLLGCLNFDPHADPAEVFAEHCRWGQLQERGRFLQPHRNEPSPERRLRIGYVSPDLKTHAVARYFEPVLAHHDATQVETYCYAEVATPDGMTAHLQSLAHAWRWICGKQAAQVVEEIRADGIDILVDLAGHTARNRLDVFALKPAPVQATWLGYVNTTGLRTVDYRITDAVMDPPCRPVLDTEELVRLPGGVVCFAPPAGAPAVTPLPALRRGRLTFGSLHKLCKLSTEVVDLWCRVLKAVPTSRLLLFRDTLTGKAAEIIREQFAERGIAGEQLDLRKGRSARGYLELYGEMDVMLDVFPYTGGTTTCESLWMGVPVLSLAGARPASRGSATLLTRVGLSDWVVEMPEEYVALAVRWANDPEGLAELRAGLRQRMTATLCDARRFTRELEDAYRTMWQRWCAQT
jgi:predicted O-linked N-acetylglucosamine transferase (SPINDLY family)